MPTCKLSLGPADGNPGGWINGVLGSSALEGSLLEASFCTEVLTWAKQTTECFFKRRTESWPALLLALVPWLPGGLNIQVIRVY